MSTMSNTEMGGQPPKQQPSTRGISRKELQSLGKTADSLANGAKLGADFYAQLRDELNAVLGETPSEWIPKSSIVELIDRHARLARAELERTKGRTTSVAKLCHDDCVKVLTKLLNRPQPDGSAVL